MTEEKFKTVITSKHRLFDLHIKEAWQYKDLLLMFVKRTFVAKYKQTVLGPLWAIIQPLLTSVVFTLIFGSLAGLPASDVTGLSIPRFLFYFSGSMCWSYISSSITENAATFLNHSNIMGKVYYPRIISPLSDTLSCLVSFSIQFILFTAMWIVFLIIGGSDICISVNLLLLPVVILEMAILSCGVGIIISSLTTKYRDLMMLVGFGLQLWQYGSPIAYGLQLASENFSNTIMTIYMLNPVTPIVTTFRYAVFGTGYFNLFYFLISIAVSVLIFFLGLLAFNKVERTFMDTI